MKVTVIGAGNMGAAFVKQLTRAGHQVTVTARNLEKAQALAGLKVDRDAPYLVLKGSGRDTTLPQPWKDASQTLTAAVTTSHWALLPWELDGL